MAVPGESGSGREQRSRAGRPERKPAWLRRAAPAPRQYRATGALLDELELHTVCDEARCPNKGECFSAGTATFLILGDACTRACRFCSVKRAAPAASPAGPGGAAPGGSGASALGVCEMDPEEPDRVAAAAARLGLRHVVVTSVTRDDLPDGGAGHFAAVAAAVRERLPEATVEVLIPDLGGDEAALGAVLAARPDVLAHNLETVPRLYPEVRPLAVYERSLELLRRAAVWARGGTWLATPEREQPPDAPAGRAAAPGAPAPGSLALSVPTGPGRPLVKTGLMVGLGETAAEVDAVLADSAAAGVDLVTVGQYLQPHGGCLPVRRFVDPAEFAALERRGAELGVTVRAAPFVRSSYRAGEALHGAARWHAAT